MVNNTPEYPGGKINKLYAFADFTHKKSYLGKGTKTVRGLPEEGDEACHYFTLQEQLWLAFLTKEKYQKIWTGEEWTH